MARAKPLSQHPEAIPSQAQKRAGIVQILHHANSLYPSMLCLINLDEIVQGSPQRALDDARVRRLFKAFDPRGLGVGAYNLRDGKIRSIDGQHRDATVQTADYHEVRGEVFTDLTDEEEAVVFSLRNNRKEMAGWIKYGGDYRTGVSKFVEPVKILRAEGFTCGLDAHLPAQDVDIVSTKVLHQGYVNRPSIPFWKAFLTVLSAWRGDHGRLKLVARRGEVQLALIGYLKLHGHDRPEDLKARLRPIDPETVWQQAKSLPSSDARPDKKQVLDALTNIIGPRRAAA